MFEKAARYMRERLMREANRRLTTRALELAAKAGHPGALAALGTRSKQDVVFWGDRAQRFARGAVTVQRRPVYPDGTHGKWETVFFDNNLVVTQAERLMAQMAIGAPNSALNYIELGDPSPTATPPQLNDIGLEQTTGQRKAVALTVSGNVVTAEATWLTTEGNGPTYTEAGLFTGPFGAGTMFARKTFSGIFKTAAFEMRFTWLISFLVDTQGGDCAGVALTGPTTVSPHTLYVASGGEVSVAATFDFVPNANLTDVFLNGQRLNPGIHYTESSAPLAVPQGGGAPGVSKGVNLTFSLLPNDEVLLVHRSIQ